MKMSSGLLKYNLSLGNEELSQNIFCTEDILEIAALDIG
jgi:hypothetical protein